MIKWKTDSSKWAASAKITPVNVERETDSSVWVKGNRLGKITDNARFFDTWDDAHSFLTDSAEIRVQAARRSLECAKGYQGNVKGMKKPD